MSRADEVLKEYRVRCDCTVKFFESCCDAEYQQMAAMATEIASLRAERDAAVRELHNARLNSEIVAEVNRRFDAECTTLRARLAACERVVEAAKLWSSAWVFERMEDTKHARRQREDAEDVLYAAVYGVAVDAAKWADGHSQHWKTVAEAATRQWNAAVLERDVLSVRLEAATELEAEVSAANRRLVARLAACERVVEAARAVVNGPFAQYDIPKSRIDALRAAVAAETQGEK